MTDTTTRAKLSWYDSPRAGRLALLTLDNGQDYRKPNVFGERALASLDEALRAVGAAADCKGLLVTGKPFVFAAGADLTEFERIDSVELGLEAARRGHEVLGRLRALDVPTLAAVNGLCLGGGLELALHCDYRTVSTSAAAIGFPEVALSIVPGWGGTQLTPRLVGAAGALKVIVHDPLDRGRTLDPEQAFALGLADRLVPAVDFMDASVALLERIVTGEETIERTPPDEDTEAIAAALAAARADADGRTHGATRAPYAAIELIEHAARGGDLGEGLRREREVLAELLPSRQAHAAVYSFGLTQQRVKRAPWLPDVPARGVAKVGVVGSGLMGAQLGSLLLGRLRVPLVMRDLDQAVLDRARASIEGEVDKRVQRGRVSAAKAAFLKGLVTYTLDVDDLAGCDLVLEAVLEELDVKRRVLAEVEQVVDPGCVLATNTSSLPVGEMASGLAHPERVVGLHFFNPVAVMPLVEVVRAERTDDVTLATAFAVTKGLRKSAVLCADSPAFVVNRVLSAFLGSCISAVRRGNTPQEIDDAVTALGLPMGPFVLLGLVGPKVAFHTAETLHRAYPERFEVDENFRRVAESGLDGVYDWTSGRPVVRPEVSAAIVRDPGADPLPAEDLRRGALEAVAREARIMLDEGVVADARDIDTALLLGAAFPFFLGGICKYLDQAGISEELFGEPLVGEVDRAIAP
jgi:3-hydroxyacyl-CoA dehydrogenase/enoyl-CoA hydratase/carnithine racemase